MTDITVQIKVSWWIKYYVQSMILFCRVFGTEPDYDKVRKIVAHGVKVKS